MNLDEPVFTLFFASQNHSLQIMHVVSAAGLRCFCAVKQRKSANPVGIGKYQVLRCYMRKSWDAVPYPLPEPHSMLYSSVLYSTSFVNLDGIGEPNCVR
jgi:hypothetical protein